MSERQIWLVEYLAEVVVELMSIEKKDRTGILNAVDKLEALGPKLAPPHMKPLQGEPDLMELRPRQGQSPARAIYARVGDGFKILAIADTHDDLGQATRRARQRTTVHGIPLGGQ